MITHLHVRVNITVIVMKRCLSYCISPKCFMGKAQIVKYTVKYITIQGGTQYTEQELQVLKMQETYSSKSEKLQDRRGRKSTWMQRPIHYNGSLLKDSQESVRGTRRANGMLELGYGQGHLFQAKVKSHMHQSRQQALLRKDASQKMYLGFLHPTVLHSMPSLFAGGWHSRFTGLTLEECWPTWCLA